MYGARHAMLHARAMPCGGGWNSGGGCQKTPDFGLVGGGRCHFQTCTTTQSQHARAHQASTRARATPAPLRRVRRGCGALRVRAPKGAGHKGAPEPCGCLICIARRVRARKGLGSEGAPEPCGRWFPSTRRVRAPRGVGVEGRARAPRKFLPNALLNLQCVAVNLY